MRNQPDAKNLLETAQDSLMADILPHLPAEKRYQAHLIGAAMATVARELAAGDGAATAERAALGDLLAADGDLVTLNRRLARAIRAGTLDDSAVAHRILSEATAAKLAECNPRYR